MKKEIYSSLFILTLFAILISSLAIANNSLTGQVIETQTASCQSSSLFVFSAQTSNESVIQINTSIKDGEVIIPILYGNGTDFTGAGKDSDDSLVTSENSEIQFRFCKRRMHEEHLSIDDTMCGNVTERLYKFTILL